MKGHQMSWLYCKQTRWQWTKEKIHES